jgi:hypothetical protein
MTKKSVTEPVLKRNEHLYIYVLGNLATLTRHLGPHDLEIHELYII